jgi:hypothetical protein
MVPEENSGRASGAGTTPLNTPHETPPASAFTAYQLAAALHRLRVLRIVAVAMREGVSQNAAAEQAREDASSVCRWRQRITACGLGIADLESGDERLIQALAPQLPPGPAPKFALGAEEANALRALVLARSAEDAMHFSLAVEEFARHPACSTLTRTLILAELDRAAAKRRAPNWPPSIRRAGYPTRQEAAAFRGRKHAQAFENVDRRGMFWTDDTGERRCIHAHSVWELDDASDNEPRRTMDPDTGGIVLTRQALWTQDLYSAAVLGLTQIARARDAYRVEDIADHLLRCVDEWGLPEWLRLERGIWDSTWLHGFVPEVPGWPVDQAWGGLEPLVRIAHVFKSKSKGGIESSFNLIQAMAAHRALSIGRTRGEFEAGTKALIRSHRTGQADPRFWPMEQSIEAMTEVARWFNSRPKQRRAFGRDLVAPDDLLRRARGAPMPAGERWRFCPVKRQATVRNGAVEVMVEHYPAPFRFQLNGVRDDLHLDHGWRVLIAFHPGRPDEGCHIFNAQLDCHNRENWRAGECLFVAPVAQDAPQIDLSGMADFNTRRKAAAAVQRSFRAIRSAGLANGVALRVDHVQDSHGRTGRIEMGIARADSSASPGYSARPRQPSAPLSRSAMDDPELRELLEETH